MPKADKHFEVIIIGGGCAGTATALSLVQMGVENIAIVDKNDFSKVRIGETIQPPTASLLKELGVWDTFLNDTHLPSFGVASAWGTGELVYSDFIFKGRGNGWHLNRNLFDQMMLRAVLQKGVKLFHHNFTEVTKDNQSWIIDCEEQILQANIVVDATGRATTFAKKQGSNKVFFDDMHSIYTYWKPLPSILKKTSTTHTQVEAVENGWWYTAYLPNNQLVVAFMSDKEEIKVKGLKHTQTFLEQLNQTEHIKKRITNFELTASPTIKVANTYHLDNTTGENWLAVGDSASAFDPLSSYGIHKSLQNGIEAATCIKSTLDGDKSALNSYEQNVKKAFEDYLEIKHGYYQMEKRWTENPFWKSRQMLVDIHPMQELKKRNDSNQPRSWNQILPKKDLNTLIELCKHPKKAFELVQHFQENSNQQYPDWRIIQAISYLCRIEVIG